MENIQKVSAFDGEIEIGLTSQDQGYMRTERVLLNRIPYKFSAYFRRETFEGKLRPRVEHISIYRIDGNGFSSANVTEGARRKIWDLLDEQSLRILSDSVAITDAQAEEYERTKSRLAGTITNLRKKMEKYQVRLLEMESQGAQTPFCNETFCSSREEKCKRPQGHTGEHFFEHLIDRV